MAQTNAGTIACKVDRATVLYRQVRALDPKFFPGEPQSIVLVVAKQNGCK